MARFPKTNQGGASLQLHGLIVFTYGAVSEDQSGWGFSTTTWSQCAHRWLFPETNQGGASLQLHGLIVHTDGCFRRRPIRVGLLYNHMSQCAHRWLFPKTNQDGASLQSHVSLYTQMAVSEDQSGWGFSATTGSRCTHRRLCFPKTSQGGASLQRQAATTNHEDDVAYKVTTSSLTMEVKTVHILSVGLAGKMTTRPHMPSATRCQKCLLNTSVEAGWEAQSGS